MIIFKFYTEHCVGQHLGYYAIEFHKFFFCHGSSFSIDTNGGPKMGYSPHENNGFLELIQI